MGNNNWEPIQESSFSDTIEDIKFAPKNVGFILAAACADGMVYILELIKDKIQNQFCVNQSYFEVAKKSLSSLSWNKQSLEPNMIIVGSSNPLENNENRLTLWVQKTNQWEKKHFFSLDKVSEKRHEIKHLGPILDVSWGLLNGRSYHHVVSCGENGVFVWKFQLIFEY